MTLSDLYDKIKSHLAAIGAIAVVVLIMVAKYSSFMIDFLTKKSKAEVDAATKQAAFLKAQEDQDNLEANALIKRANELSAEQKPVQDDWYKAKK